MKMLDKILYQRLDRIRDELNSYIAEQIDLIHNQVLISPSSMRHESIGGFVEKCLNVMPQKEDEEDSEIEDFEFADENIDDEEELYKKSISTYRPSAPVRQMSAPPQPMSSARPVEIPDFLRSECQKRSIDEVLENKAETFSSM